MIDPKAINPLQPSTDRFEDDFNIKSVINTVSNDEQANYKELRKKDKKKKSKKKAKNRKSSKKSKKKDKSKAKGAYVLEMASKIANLEISVKQLEHDNNTIIAGCKKLEAYQRQELLNKIVESEEKSERKRLAGNSLLGGI